MPQLITPTATRHEAWLAAHRDWAGATEHGSGLSPSDDVDTPAGFAAWVSWLNAQPDVCPSHPDDHVPATYWWIASDDEILGAITLRHRLNRKLLEAAGNIGYGIRPSARGRGIATWALREVLREARATGLDRVLLTCDDANPASAAVIERCGGVLEDVRDTWMGHTRRYWITLT